MLVYDSKLEGYTYTPQEEKDSKSDTPFRVKLKLLSVEEQAELADILVTRTATEVKNNYGLYYVQACYKGITDWENVIDSEGNEVKMTKTARGLIDTKSLNKIPYMMIEEIGIVIMAVSENPKKLSVFADK